MIRKLALIGLVALFVASGAFAQQPTWKVEFTPSADHSNVDNAGTPLVTKYELAVTGPGGTATPVTVRQDLGKPTCTTLCTVDINATILPLPAGSYTATVTAIGPGGSGTSAVSAPFTLQGPMRAPAAPTGVRVLRS